MRERILIVDDEIEYCKSLSELLEEKGFRCVFTPKPQNTLSIVKQQDISFILMDVRMPEMDGMEALNILHGLYPNIDVYMMSAYFSNEQEKMAYKQGAKRVFYMLLNLNKLFDSIQENKANNEKLPYGKRC